MNERGSLWVSTLTTLAAVGAVALALSPVREPVGSLSRPMSAAALVPPSRGIPGVGGWGASALTTCNRDSVYIETVTSLASSGPGTLDSILTNAQHGDTLTIVVWGIGGWGSISWDGTLSCVYLAGQTAPGGGVGYHSKGRMLRIRNDSHDFVVRGITWAGDAVDAANPTSTPNISIEDAQDWIWMENDHLWAVEKNISVGPLTNLDTVKNATIYRNIFAQAQALEPTSLQITTSNVTSPLQSHISLARNLFHSNSHRNPQITTAEAIAKYDATPRVRAVGNVWYNSGNQGHLQVRGRMVDVIDGYVKSGPMTNDGNPSGADYSWTVSVHTTNSGRPDSASSVHVERLVGVHNRDTTTASAALWWDGGADTLTAEVSCYYRNCRDPAGGGDPTTPLDAGIIRATRMTPATDSLLRSNPFDLPDEIFGTAGDSGQVGAYRRVLSDGSMSMRSDSVHAALLEEARDSAGVSSPPDSNYVAARQQYSKASGSAPADTDGDGLPDDFEKIIGGSSDSTSATRQGDGDTDGWSNAEEYANGTDPTTSTPGGGAAPSTAPQPTYASGGRRFVYRVDATCLSIIVAGTDTFPGSCVLDKDDYPDSVSFVRFLATPDSDRALVVTCDSIDSGDTPLDSIEAGDSAAVFGHTGSALRGDSVPGC